MTTAQPTSQTVTVGDNLRAERARKGWSQEQLATRSGVTPATISRIESGKDPLFSTATKLARALGCPIDSLLPQVAA